jgi:hypothetical protein
MENQVDFNKVGDVLRKNAKDPAFIGLFCK